MKKITLAIGLIATSYFIPSTSAMDMMETSNIHTDTMNTTSDSMMKRDGMTQDMNKMSLQVLVKHHGYTWSKDRKKLAMMAGIVNYRGTVKQNLMIRSYLLSDMGMKEKMMKNANGTAPSDNMMKKEVGIYSTYSSTAVTSALTNGKTVYLFFAASWCPACRSLDASITSEINTLPENTIIFKVDYDNSTDLKKKYGVTMQHTVVKLNSDATLMKKIIGPKSIVEIIK